MAKAKWEIVHDCDDDEGNPSSWSLEINHEKHGKYIWISLYPDGRYKVEALWYYGVSLDDPKILADCKSLTSAKRWVTMNLL